MVVVVVGSTGRAWQIVFNLSGRKCWMLVEKCKPLGKTVLIEILKLKNARMKVIIVVPASTGAACIVLMVQVCSHVWTGYK